MKQAMTTTTDFRENIRRTLENTLNFENHTLFEKYDYEQENKKVGSVLNLCIQHNFIHSYLIPYLRETSPLQSMTISDRKEFDRNPLKLSYYKYGVTDYWWILLAVNGYFNPSEFHDFQVLRIPSQASITSIIDKEMFNNKQYGIVPK